MRNFSLIAQNVDTIPLAAELFRQPKLWNQHNARTTIGSVHEAVDDIWIRFRKQSELISAQSYAESFQPVMYPAWHALPALRPLVFGLMARLQAVQLGLVLITRVPPGERVLPHDDRGRWAAEYFETKVYIPLKSNDRVINTCGDDAVCMRVSEAWCFDNLITHATINDGDDDRITLIVSMRVES